MRPVRRVVLMAQVADVCGAASTWSGRHLALRGYWVMRAAWRRVAGRPACWVEAKFSGDDLVEGYAGEGNRVLRVLPTVHSLVGEMILQAGPLQPFAPDREDQVREVVRVVSVVLGEDVMGPATTPSGLTEPVVESRPIGLWRHLRADHAGLVPMPVEGISARAAVVAHDLWHLTHDQAGQDGHRHAVDDDAWLLAVGSDRGVRP